MNILSETGQSESASAIDVLIPIWQRVLQRSCIGIEDNFFDLGGDFTLATELFAEIAKLRETELPAETIVLAPTIASLAPMLAQPAQAFPSLTLLKAGTLEPPVYVSHGLGGSILEILPIARRIQTPHAIYGIQAPGIDNPSVVFSRVEDLAQFHLDEIRKLQPRGPYCLIGYSFGGLVMYEIARRLLGCDENVALVAMLDTY